MRNWGRKQLQSRSVVAVVGVGAHRHTDTNTDTSQFALGERKEENRDETCEKIVSCRLANLHIRRTWAHANSHHTLLHEPLPNSKTKRPSRES